MTPFQEESSSWVRIRAALLVLVAARLNACARVVSIAGLRRGVLLCASEDAKELEITFRLLFSLLVALLAFGVVFCLVSWCSGRSTRELWRTSQSWPIHHARNTPGNTLDRSFHLEELTLEARTQAQAILAPLQHFALGDRENTSISPKTHTTPSHRHLYASLTLLPPSYAAEIRLGSSQCPRTYWPQPPSVAKGGEQHNRASSHRNIAFNSWNPHKSGG
ncbi:hypothetical protein Q7P35_006650 [Cladosporium inversicolor]